jgi:hypothetical protein
LGNAVFGLASGFSDTGHFHSIAQAHVRLKLSLLSPSEGRKRLVLSSSSEPSREVAIHALTRMHHAIPSLLASHRIAPANDTNARKESLQKAWILIQS